MLVQAALVLLSLSAAASAQGRVWVVDAASGPGTDFVEVTAALTAVSDGDVILVRTGAYAGFVVDGLDVVVTADLDAAVDVAGGIEVRNVPAGKSVTLRRIDAAASQGAGFAASSCAGRIWIEKCALAGSSGVAFQSGGEGARIEGCAAVSITRCGLSGGDGGIGSTGAGRAGGHGLFVDDSSVTVHGATASGGSGTWGDDIGGPAGSGMFIDGGSTVYAAGSTFRGGDGGGAEDDYDFLTGALICGYCEEGGAGVMNTWGATAHIALRDNVYVPGEGGKTTSAKGCWDGADGVPIADHGAFPVEVLTGTARDFRTSSPRRAGEASQLGFQGLPGDLAFALVGTEPAQLALPPVAGVLLAGPVPLVVSMGALPAGGLLQVPVTVPDLPVGVEGRAFYLQALIVSPALELLFAAPSQVTILDAAF